jgi:hypothetical protein
MGCSVAHLSSSVPLPSGLQRHVLGRDAPSTNYIQKLSLPPHHLFFFRTPEHQPLLASISPDATLTLNLIVNLFSNNDLLEP